MRSTRSRRVPGACRRVGAEPDPPDGHAGEEKAREEREEESGQRPNQGSWAASPPARVPRARQMLMSTSEPTLCTLPSIIVTPTPAGW